MTLLVLEHGREWEPMAYLAADGVIYQSVNKNPGPALRIVGDRIQRPTGEPVGQCEAGSGIRFGPNLALRFDADDALVDPRTGLRAIYVRDSGEVEAAISGPPRLMPWRVQGVAPATRRTAEILVLAAMGSIDWHVH